MTGKFYNIQISGISVAVPSFVEKNELAMEYLGARRCKKQIKMTGIEQRHVSAEGQKMSDLCYVAARRLLDHLGWEPGDIKVLLLVTQFPNYMTPSTAFLLQKMLNIPPDCIVFDVNLGCTAFNEGFHIASSLLQPFPEGSKALCLQGDLAFRSIGPGIDVDAMAGSMLFGSAGSVTAIEKKTGVPEVPFATFSDGARYEAILRHHTGNVHMDGQEVFNFSTNDVVTSIKDFFMQTGISDDMVDFYAFHQAQKLILDSISGALGVSEEKELRSLALYGNTSGASVPLSICFNRDRYAEKSSIKVFSCGFGVGLAWSMAYTSLATKNILPVIETDKIFEG